MLDQFLSAITFGMTRTEINAVIRAGWRVVIAAHIAIACGWLTAFGLTGFARAGDISGVKEEVSQLSTQFTTYLAQEKVDGLERQLKDLDGEIFSIEARLTEIGRLGQQADQLYAQRLTTLRSQKAAVERELAQALKHPALQAALQKATE